jgi:hypothetical protein
MIGDGTRSARVPSRRSPAYTRVRGHTKFRNATVGIHPLTSPPPPPPPPPPSSSSRKLIPTMATSDTSLLLDVVGGGGGGGGDLAIRVDTHRGRSRDFLFRRVPANRRARNERDGGTV